MKESEPHWILTDDEMIDFALSINEQAADRQFAARQAEFIQELREGASMTTINVLSKALNLIQLSYRHQAVVAGGAAVDLTRASDIDIFVLNLPVAKDLQLLLKAIEGLPGIEFAASDLNLEYTGPNRHIATIPGILPIQIMASECVDVTDLLSNFDLSTHCVAVSPDGNVHTIAQTTPPTSSPHIVNLRNPEKTLDRYRKLCLRYGIQPDLEDLRRLCTTPDPIKDEF